MSIDILSKGIEQFGLRFSLVGIFPSLFFILFIFSLFVLTWSSKPTIYPDINVLLDKINNIHIKEGIFLIVISLITALVLQPLQYYCIALLKGNYGNLKWGNVISRVLLYFRKKEMKTLESIINSSNDNDKIINAQWKLRQFYPEASRLLPTTLGNVLRACEDLAGWRYNLDPVVIWPRLYPLLPENLKKMIDDQRIKLDITCRLCIVFIGCFIVSVFFYLSIIYRVTDQFSPNIVFDSSAFLLVLVNYSYWIAIPLATLALSWISYKSAVLAALSYGIGIQTAFDLCRFDLLKSLHLPLPSSYSSEMDKNYELSEFLSLGNIHDFKYDDEKLNNTKELSHNHSECCKKKSI
jgi:hypothetical protein